MCNGTRYNWLNHGSCRASHSNKPRKMLFKGETLVSLVTSAMLDFQKWDLSLWNRAWKDRSLTQSIDLNIGEYFYCVSKLQFGITSCSCLAEEVAKLVLSHHVSINRVPLAGFCVHVSKRWTACALNYNIWLKIYVVANKISQSQFKQWKLYASVCKKHTYGFININSNTAVLCR